MNKTFMFFKANINNTANKDEHNSPSKHRCRQKHRNPKTVYFIICIIIVAIIFLAVLAIILGCTLYFFICKCIYLKKINKKPLNLFICLKLQQIHTVVHAESLMIVSQMLVCLVLMEYVIAVMVIFMQDQVVVSFILT